eukprot:Hpha_TRINITY_DN22288_c0_g1::TRINITY_DN22288_c0_g1_i1::g.167075::m.167075
MRLLWGMLGVCVCGAAAGVVVLGEEELALLVRKGVLQQVQADYLKTHHTKGDQGGTTGFDATESWSADNVLEDGEINPLAVVTMFLSTANVFYGTSCLVLTVAYGVLLAYTYHTPEVQLGVTMVYHYLFHTIAGKLAQTLTSRILAAGLYMGCCIMPAVCAGIVLLSPGFADQWRRVFVPASDCLKQWERERNPPPRRPGDAVPPPRSAASRESIDVRVAKTLPLQAYITCTALCVAVMCGAGFYMWMGVAFAGIPALFLGAVWVLTLIAAVYSLRIDSLEDILPEGVERVAYASVLYSVLTFAVSHMHHSPIVCTAALISGLNAGVWSFPVVLFFTISPEVDWASQPNVARRAPHAVFAVLQQNGNTRYTAWVLSTIMFFLILLRYAILRGSWLPLPYAALGLFVASAAVKADAARSVVVHMPIAVGLFHASFAFMNVVDRRTLEALAWLAPESVLLWALTTFLRSLTSVVTVVQLSRAVHWLTIPLTELDPRHVRENDDGAQIQKQPHRCLVHLATLYGVTSGLIFLARSEPNYIISLVAFEFTALMYIGMLCRSAFIFLKNSREALSQQVQCAVWVTLLSRLFVNCGTLYLLQIIILLAAIALPPQYSSFDHTPYPFVTVGVGITAATGIRHNAPALILAALVGFLAAVARLAYDATKSKRVALIVLSACAIVLVQVGFMFENGHISLAYYVVQPWEEDVLRLSLSYGFGMQLGAI